MTLTRTSSSTLYNLRNGIPEKRRRREMSSGRSRSRHDLHLIFFILQDPEFILPPPGHACPLRISHPSSFLYPVAAGLPSSFGFGLGHPRPQLRAVKVFLGVGREGGIWGRLVWAEGSNWLLGLGGEGERRGLMKWRRSLPRWVKRGITG